MTELPRKIAYVTDARGWGGAEVYLTQLAESARKRGLEPHFYCADSSRADGWVEELRRRDFRVQRFRTTKEFNPLGCFIARRFLRGYEIVHVNKTHPRHSLPAVVAARMAGARVVVATEHLATPPVSHFPFGQRIITLLVRLTNRMIDRTIAVSELSRDMLIENYAIDPSKIVAVRNGVELARFDQDFDLAAVRSELGLNADDRVALLAGEFVARKGHRYALRALPAVLREVPGCKLVLAGGGELEGDLRAEADALGISDSVVFAGFRRDIPAILAASDLLLLPSEIECLPLVILEAMASRLPVISTDVGGISEAIEHGVTGLLVEPRDPEGLAGAIVEILADPERGRTMGEAGRKKAEARFTSAASAEAVFRLYEKLLSGTG